MDKNNNSKPITCCQLTLLSSGIHDYAQMKKAPEKYNPEKLIIWQLGIFEGHVLLLEALKKDKKLCEKCVAYSGQLLAIRQAWENKI